MTANSTVTIRTPEGIEFHLRLAGLFHRMAALAIDLGVIMAAAMIFEQVTSVVSVFSEDASQAIGLLLYFAISLGYGMTMEWFWRGQTLGKRLLKLRVVDASGLRLTPAQVVMRNVLRFLDFLPGLYLVGGASCFLSSRGQRLGDIAAGTVVVCVPKVAEPDVKQLLGNRFNSLAQHRHLVARLRQKVSPELAWLALEAILRREALTPEARVKIFNEFAGYLKNAVPFPPEIEGQLPDEQYVRNVVELLFNRWEVSGSTAREAKPPVTSWGV